MAASKMPNASRVSPASASPTPASCEPSPESAPPDSRYRRAARQIGHHWPSGGSVVAVSQTLARFPLLPPPPIVDLTLLATSRPRLRAPAFISHRWKSAIGSLPGSLISVTVPLQLHHIGHPRGAEVAHVDAFGAADPDPAGKRVVHMTEEGVAGLGPLDHVEQRPAPDLQPARGGVVEQFG